MSWVIRKLERWGGHPPAMVPRYFTGAGFSTNDGTRFVFPIVTGPRGCSRRSVATELGLRRCPCAPPWKTRCLDAHCPCLKGADVSNRRKPRPPPRWVTAEDIVDEFGVSSSTAYEWLKQMPHFREGRIIAPRAPPTKDSLESAS